MFSIIFTLIGIGFCLALAVAIFVLLPLFIITIPYNIWVGSQNLKGQYKHLKNESFGSTVKNSFKLYKSWILRKTPSL